MGCSEKSGCEYYTYYYLESEPYYETCVLLSSLQPPVQDCPSFVTGPLHCDQPADCSFLYNGHNHTHLIFTEPGVNITFSTIGGSYFTECQLRVLAVGGGGKSGNDAGYVGGGGGSGYIQYHTQTILSGSPAQISVMVGNHGEASTINMVTGDTIQADPGQDGYYDGEDHGGDGQYKLDCYIAGYDCGGGGGGVLVDGAGPGVEEENNRGEAQWSNGKGYGGGGTGSSSNDGNGHSGVIILEIFGAN